MTQQDGSGQQCPQRQQLQGACDAEDKDDRQEKKSGQASEDQLWGGQTEQDSAAGAVRETNGRCFGHGTSMGEGASKSEGALMVGAA
ncbi:hypothetical protein GCM10018771_39480 [Streptomyces cellulosae]|nr:hypothetical protein GCM10018771_39480 [Streptomyces cellulosae]